MGIQAYCIVSILVTLAACHKDLSPAAPRRDRDGRREHSQAALRLARASSSHAVRIELRDQLLPQLVVEIVETHPDDYTFQARGAVAVSVSTMRCRRGRSA